ncbi:MAG: glycosyltransferase family 39 protein [Anaerolineae bacterium]|nr:glycosyltransferase family 39 protein [Anaerolineae bacterium]
MEGNQRVGLESGADGRRRTYLARLGRIAPTAAALAILLLGFGLRVYRLGDQNIWWDEGHAIWAARQSLRQVTDITAHDVHPPLYLWMLHVWLPRVGESEFAVRYLSLCGGMLSVALTYVVARRLTGSRAALLAMLLIAIARFHIWWSQEARMYVWATTFALLSVHHFTRLRNGRSRAWWAYIASSAAAMYTLYLSALVLIVENLFVAITIWRHHRRRRFVFHWGLSQLGILALYSPWLYMAMDSRTDVGKSPFSFRLIWQLYGTVLVTGISTDLDRYTWLVVAFALLAGAGLSLLVLSRRQPQRHMLAGWEVALLLALPLLVPPLVVYGLSIPRGFFYSPKPEARYLLLFAPLAYILLAGTIASYWRAGWRGRALSVAGALLVLGTFVGVLPSHYAGRYLRDEVQTAIATLRTYRRADDAVLLVSGDRYPVFLYYYNRAFPEGAGPDVYLIPQHAPNLSAETVEAELGPIAERYDRLWLASFERALQDPENLAEKWLDARRTLVLHVAQEYNSLRLYARAPVQPLGQVGRSPIEHPYPAPHALGEGLTVLGYDLPTTEFRPGDMARPGVYVRASSAHRLVADWTHSSGRVVESQLLDVPAISGENAFVRLAPAFVVYTYTPPGPYAIQLRLPEGQATGLTVPAGQVTRSRSLPQVRPEAPNEVSLHSGCITFLGHTVRPRSAIQGGASLTVDLFWRAECAIERDYTVFVHLLGPYNPATGGPVWAQDDAYPLQGGHPTTRWAPGETVPDRHRLDIPPAMPAGSYPIEVGLYDAASGERVVVAGSTENRIMLEGIDVASP